MARRRRQRRKNSLLPTLIIIIALAWGLMGRGNQNKLTSAFTHFTNQNINEPVAINKAGKAQTSYGGLSRTDYQKLAKLNFKSGHKAYVVVNHDHSTLNKNAWRVNRVIYANLDSLNRTSHSNTGFLEKRNVADDSLRVRQFIEPTGWHYNRRNGVQIYNRGHLIAYSVSAGIDQKGNYEPNNQSGDQNNPKNLFTQSAFSNQKVQTIFEGRVRQALREGKQVIYQATPIFRGHDLMARGIDLQAISTDGILDFNVYLFNVQPGFTFNYRSGRAQVDHAMRVKE